MKTNKTLLAALALSFTLVGCNQVVENENTDSPVVEEEAGSNEAAVDTNEATPADGEVDDATSETESAEGEAVVEEDASGEEVAGEASEAEAPAGEEASETPIDTSTPEGKRDALEQAIFDNRTQARAIELLFELTPENVEEVRPQLEALLEKSNDLLAKAQTALDQLGGE